MDSSDFQGGEMFLECNWNSCRRRKQDHQPFPPQDIYISFTCNKVNGSYQDQDHHQYEHQNKALDIYFELKQNKT